VIEAGGEGRGLSEVFAKPDENNRLVGFLKGFHRGIGFIAAAIVDIDDLKSLSEFLAGVQNLDMQFLQVLFFVIDRNHDGELRFFTRGHPGKYITIVLKYP